MHSNTQEGKWIGRRRKHEAKKKQEHMQESDYTYTIKKKLIPTEIGDSLCLVLIFSNRKVVFDMLLR